MGFKDQDKKPGRNEGFYWGSLNPVNMRFVLYLNQY